MKGKNWLITHNNPTVDTRDYLEKWSKICTYVNGQLEKGAEGTPHIQAYISLTKESRITGLKKHDPHAHFTLVTKDNGASAYCMKTETQLEGPFEFGNRPLNPASKTDWDQIRRYAETGELNKIDSAILIRYYGNLKKIEKDHQVIPPRTTPKTCLWYWGEPGTGKTRKATDDNPDAYKKLANRWWDGYQGQKTVILDDIGKDTAKCLVNHLKLWADPWQNHPGEDKGGQKVLSYDTFIVTSNYDIDDLEISGVDLAALKRRFQIHHFGGLLGGTPLSARGGMGEAPMGF